LDLVLGEIKQIAKTYRLTKITGDQFAHQALAQLFRDRGIGDLEKFDVTADSKRETYTAFKLRLAQGKTELLDHPESLRQLRLLEAKRISGGGVKIGAPPGMHDDFPAAQVLVSSALTKKNEIWVDFIRAR
jgi:hypothetical protein